MKQQDLLATEVRVTALQSYFEQALEKQLTMYKIQAPLFVWSETGLNDNLNGTEQAVSFAVNGINGKKAEVVHSLAKWKRMALAERSISIYQGIYLQMNAIRADEIPGPLHSLFVDQWDWEMVISESDRHIDFLKGTVKKLYRAIKETEAFVAKEMNWPRYLPEDIYFIHSEDLLRKYPDLTAKERENEICKAHGAVFLIGIGASLSNGEAHDGRAPDYDDWCSETAEGYYGLNGDILLWNPQLECAHEISSMGIRVTKESLKAQLHERNAEDRLELPFHKALMRGELPQSIGGGIGRSRLAMYLLRKKHIKEVQQSLWPEEEGL